MLKQIVAASALFAMPVAANATQIILAPVNVVGSSGFYDACCDFKPSNILDQQTGTVTEIGQNGFWLNKDGGPADAYITVKIGSGNDGVALTGFDLYNTHNGPYADRGTGDFSIFGSNFISGGQLVAPTLILSGTLAAQNVNGGSIAQSFLASGTYRYISFNPTSVAVGTDGIGNGVPCCGANNYGLTELRVFGAAAAVPEPQSWVLLIAGFGLVGAAMRRRAMLAA
jgi:hypothetical protein